MTSDNPLEARLFRAFWDDGLLDLFFGVGAAATGVCWALDLVPLGAAVPALLALFWNPVRKAVIEPRAGWVEFARARSESSRRKLRGSIAIGAGALFLFVAFASWTRAGDIDLVRSFAAGVPAMLIGFMACLVAAGLKIARFLLYALVFVAAGIAVARADLEPEVAILAGGLVVALSGTGILARFLRGSERDVGKR